MDGINFKRRHFLSMGAIAGLAAPASAAVAPPQTTGGKKFRLGFIGMGRQGRSNLRNALKQPEVEVVAFSEVYKPNLDEALEIVPGAKVYGDFRDLIAAPDIDAVCISTPDHWHAYMSIEACKAGKDVYVEKPISVVVEEGRLMVEAARKYNRVVQVGTQQRSGVHFQRAAGIVQSGKLGKISFVRTWNYGNQFPEGIGNPPDSDPPRDLNWDMWLGPAAMRPFNKNRFGVDPDAFSHFRWFWDYAGGMMTDWGIHLLDIVLLAMKVEGPNVITCFGQNKTLHDNRETPDTIQATYEFDDFICVYENRIANSESMFGQGYGITFHGTEGTLFVDRNRWEVTPETRRSDRNRSESVARMVAEKGSSSNNHGESHWENFVRCMKTRERPASDIENGHRSTATALLGNVALRSRQRVEWNPRTETTPNAEARSYLRREYRAPWKLTL